MTVVDANLNAGVLASLPAALRNDTALTSLLGTVDGTVAVPTSSKSPA